MAVHATTPARARLCEALGCEFGAYLPPRGPVFVAARVDDMGRAMPAEEIARMAAFLVSTECAFVAGGKFAVVYGDATTYDIRYKIIDGATGSA